MRSPDIKIEIKVVRSCNRENREDHAAPGYEGRSCNEGIYFVDLRDAGDPVEFAVLYQKEGADELAMLDIVATLENRGTRLECFENVSSVIDIPLTVGGAISTLEDIDLTLEAGADKVSINSAAVNNPDLIQEAAEKFGSERITVVIDGCRNREMPSGFEVVVASGTKRVGRDAVEWAKECKKLGAGVILPTSIDADGTQRGYDLEYTRVIADAVKVPVIASGGQENCHISTMQLNVVVLPYCRLLQFFTSASLVSGKSRNIYFRRVWKCPFNCYNR
jgi:cyclase